ncbi:hypothetical protein ROG8370_00404 [Roseovarius gaetbuli]|uniref:Lipoprotein n=1 Tax=Roseovarius gaetbuli TaxID=1356575 RepID=A0A1X6YB36_9RHOB|nr:hypothetical protein [Roseovarius gaetbuli]SLN15301.1 hypothetical protein ROG8370_00404 [Roseovarius gaetbuli]
MKHAVMMTLAVLMLAGCTERSERAIFDGNYYPPKTRAEKEDRRNFTASVRRASRGIEGAQKAALHEATRYCLESFGTSEIKWSGVAKGEGPVYGRSGDTVSVTGRCIIWK